MAKLSENDIRLIGKGAGVIQGVTEKVIREGQKLGLTFADFHHLATPDGDKTLSQMLGIIVAAKQASKIVCPNAKIERRITLTIKRPANPVDLLLGTECDYIYPWMKTHHPDWKGPESETITVALIDMGENFNRDDSLAVILRLGCEVCIDNAALWTISGSKENRNLQREIGIMDPETVWLDGGGDECVAALYGSSGGRHAYLGGIASSWYRRCRVLALCKKQV